MVYEGIAFSKGWLPIPKVRVCCPTRACKAGTLVPRSVFARYTPVQKTDEILFRLLRKAEFCEANKLHCDWGANYGDHIS